MPVGEGEIFLLEIFQKGTRKTNSMEIRFGPRPMALDHRCFMRVEQPVAGLRLKAEYLKPGRPEVIKTILLVDDDSNFLKMALLLIDKYSVKVVATDTKLLIREQVFNLINEHKPDLIVVDGQMPDISGSQLVKELRQNFGYSGYIAANSSSGEQMMGMMEEGADFMIESKIFFNFLGYLEAQP